MSWPPSPQYPGQPGPEQPYGGHPGQPQPGYGAPQPGYPQPGYGQPDPGYGQPNPGYGQPVSPGYGQSAGDYAGVPGQSYPGSDPALSYPGYPGPPAPKKSKGGMIALIVLAVVLLLCGGGGVLVYQALKDPIKEAAQAAKTKVVEPETLAGRAKIANAELQSVADDMITSLRADIPEAKDVVGAFYGDPLKEDMIMIVAVSGLIADPAKELDEALTTVRHGELELTGVKTVDPGPLGGEARCGDAKAEGIDLGVCIWVDRGSLGMVVMYFATSADLAKDFVQIRGQIEIVE